MSELGHSMDMPFEENPPGQTMDLEHAHIASGVVVIAAVGPVDESPKPCLVFRFATPTGGFYPPMLLVLDDDQATKLPGLVTSACEASIDAARKSS